MTLLGLVGRRFTTHRAALLAVAVTILAIFTATASFALLTDRVGEAAVIRGVLEAPASERAITVRLSTNAQTLPDTDGAVRTAFADHGLTIDVRSATLAGALGIIEAGPDDRAQLADVGDPGQLATLMEGRWPALTAPETPLEVAAPPVTLETFGWSVGEQHDIVGLTGGNDSPISLLIVGSYAPNAAADPETWPALGLVADGVAEGDFPTYGPFLTAPGDLTGPLASGTSTTWLATPDLSGLDSRTLPATLTAVDDTLTALEDQTSTGQVTTSLPDLLQRSLTASDRVRLVTVTPTLLGLVLGAVALAVAAALMAAIREDETRLLRARGAGQGEIGWIALIEGVALTVPGAIVAVGLSFLLAPPLLAGADLPPLPGGPLQWSGIVARNGALAAAVAIALVLIVTAALRAGHLRSDRVLRAPLITTTADVILLALGALGVLQLRRYSGTGGLVIDPLTVLAPVLVVGGLAVLALRLIPLLARAAEAVTRRASGVRAAWAGWQVARRVSSQRGSVLLIVLAVAVGTLAISFTATAQRAWTDQAAFIAGAPLRVGPGVEVTNTSALGQQYAALGGGPAHVMPVHSRTATVGTSDDVSIIAADLARDVLTPRADTIDNTTWNAVRDSLIADRPSDPPGLAIPGEPTTLTIDAVVEGVLHGVRPDARMILEDADRVRWAVPVPVTVEVALDADGLRYGETARISGTVDLTTPDASPTYPLRLVALQQFFRWDVPDDTIRIDLRTLTADGAPVPDLSSLEVIPVRLGVGLGSLGVPVPDVPVALTAAVARDAQVAVGDTIGVPIEGRVIVGRVVALLETLPTARVPDKGLLVDLPTLNSALDSFSGNPSGPIVLRLDQWWLDPATPADADATRAALAAEPRLATTLVDQDALIREARQSPVSSGLQAIMTLLTVTAVVLAALGFAATTAALSRGRRHESAVLEVLGLSPRSLRGALVAERAAIVVLSVAVGAVVGLVVSRLTLPLILAADGRRQVPPVLVQTPWVSYAAALIALSLLLTLLAALVLRPRQNSPAAVLRGEMPR